MEGYFKNPQYRFYEKHKVFLFALKCNLYKEVFLCGKTKGPPGINAILPLLRNKVTTASSFNASEFEMECSLKS